MKRLGMLQHMSLVALAAMTFTAACGDDDENGTPDARRVDAPVGSTFDAPPGATFDAPPSTVDARQADAGPIISGTVAIHEVKLFGADTALGPVKGGQIDISFALRGDQVSTVTTAGTFGALPPCTVVVSDVTNATHSNPDTDEGTVAVSVTPMGGSATALPTCSFQSGDFRCTRGPSSGGTITQSANDLVGTFAATAFTFNAADVGAWLIVPGATLAETQAWPIVGVNGMNAGLQKVAAFPGTAIGAFFIQYGVGPMALRADPNGANPMPAPEFFADTDAVSVSFTPKSGSRFSAFTANSIAVGDDFELDDASEAILANGLDVNSASAITFKCAAGSCAAGSAAGIIVSIETTDTPGGGPTTLNPPTKFRGSLTCAAFATEVSIPVSHLAALKLAEPEKMRITVFRDNFSPQGATNIVVGHGIVAFPNAPAPPTKPAQ